MQINKENLTIIIVTLKSDKVIHKCLKSIDPQIKKIVVENSSNEQFIENLQKKYDNLKCYLTGQNLGMGPGNNFGIKKAKTNFVMILNPDTILNFDTLDKIFHISKNLDYAIISPISSDKNYPNYKKRDNFTQKFFNSDLLEVDQVDGFAMILNKSKFEDTFFDEKIFMYLENDDLCYRMKKKKEKVFIYKQAFINHLGAQAVDDKFHEELEFSRNWHWNWSKFYYRKKHYSFIFALLKGLPSFLNSYIKFIIYFILQNKFKYKIHYCRVSGFYNSLINKNAWYRPRLD